MLININFLSYSIFNSIKISKKICVNFNTYFNDAAVASVASVGYYNYINHCLGQPKLSVFWEGKYATRRASFHV